MFIDILTDAAIDSVELLPFLFIAFCILETFSHHSEHLNTNFLLRFKYAGPFLGALLGCIPQCGIPVLAINLYSGMLITPGTLIAVLISTSDEAIIMLLKEPAGQKIVLPLLLIKLISGIFFGYLVDLILRKFFIPPQNGLLHEEHDFCKTHGILLSALGHTIELFTYIFIFTFALNFLLQTIGFQILSKLVLNGSIFQPLLTALIGFIPNCASALLLCELYLDGMLQFPAIISGLCTSAGVGLLVLFKAHMPKKEFLKIIGFLYLAAITTGLLLQIFI